MIIKKILIVGFALLSVVPSAYPMAAANPATKRVAMELFKKGIEKGTTALHWGIAAGPCLVFAGKFLMSSPLFNSEKEKTANMLKRMHPAAAKEYEKELHQEEVWLRQELKKLDYQDWETVELARGIGCAASGILDKKRIYYEHLIGEAKAECDSSLHALKVRLGLANYDKYNQVRGILCHEIIHLENHHTEKIIATGISLPILTHLMYQKIFNFKNLPGASSFGLRNTIKVATAIPKLIVNLSGLWLGSYLAEKEADEGIINDPIILDAEAKSMREHSHTLEKRKNKSWESYLKNLFDVHPDPLKRAQRFEERANNLRTEQLKIEKQRTARLRAALQKI
ncbi:hypothetical protein BH09DEP1_BH09DEP1_3710 [soil metagenome]